MSSAPSIKSLLSGFFIAFSASKFHFCAVGRLSGNWKYNFLTQSNSPKLLVCVLSEAPQYAITWLVAVMAALVSIRLHCSDRPLVGHKMAIIVPRHQTLL